MSSRLIRPAKRPGPGWLLSLALVAAFFGEPPLGSRAQVDPPPKAASDLWQKAVEICRANREWYPGQAAIASEIRNGGGKRLSFTEISVTLRPEGRGRLQVQLDRYLRNGVDTTEVMRPKMKISDPLRTTPAWDDDGNSVAVPGSPLDPEEQGDVTWTLNGETRIIEGRGCRRYDFTFRRELDPQEGHGVLTWQGRAWLEIGSGRPVELQFSIDPLPSKIRSMGVIYHYRAEPPGRWVVKEVIISGSGGFLFIKRYFTVTTVFNRFGPGPAMAGNR